MLSAGIDRKFGGKLIYMERLDWDNITLSQIAKTGFPMISSYVIGHLSFSVKFRDVE